jgi:histidine triad (HIT) family protein
VRPGRRALVTEAGAEHVYSAVVGHRVAHLHVHLIPRYPGTPAELEWHQVTDWPGGRSTEPEATALAIRLRRTLADHD